MPILTVKNLKVVLNGHAVLRNITFDLERGENLAIIGPNGSGKTVLLKTLLGMLNYEGEINWAPDVKIGYVPQKIDADRHLPLHLLNLLTAKAKILKLSHKDIHETVEIVGLNQNNLKTPIGHLSGGQFQKALIAFAFLGKPNVILFDEPTASLDQLAEEHTYELMEDIQKKHGITMIVVSHELNFVAEYSSKVLCLNRDQICFGPPDETLDKDIIHHLYGESKKMHIHHENHS